MNETIRLMKSHFLFAVLRKKPSKKLDLKEILSAGQMASSWKNFQSYSVIVVKSKEKKEAPIRLASSRSNSPISRLSFSLLGFKPR